MNKYIAYDVTRLSDLELFQLVERLAAKGYQRLQDRGDYAIFIWKR